MCSKKKPRLDEVVIPVQGGTFYLLPAGTPIQDTSRIFQDPNLGLLITQLRQDYDLIIIDSPPVLPVPDALILGRWADGAVLAARYDISRFPQVERARRQLDNAGIAIMGTVINGMRNADSYYGRYSHSRRRSARNPVRPIRSRIRIDHRDDCGLARRVTINSRPQRHHRRLRCCDRR